MSRTLRLHGAPTCASEQTSSPASQRLITWFRDMAQWAGTKLTRRATFARLRALSDHHLNDIGLARADIERASPGPILRDPGDTLHRYRDMIGR
ncbi:MAG: DUF1127 domain-containing protein [Pseudomonadota bacterium]